MRLCRDYLIAIGLVSWVKDKLNINRSTSGTSEQWNSYDHWLKTDHPYIYKFEEFMDKVQNVVCYAPTKLTDFKFYLKNIFIHKTHHLQTGLPIGAYFEIDIRLLHAMFNTLKIFVDVELKSFGTWATSNPNITGMQYIDHVLEDNKELSPFDNSYQREKYAEIKSLYNWWETRVDYDWNTLEDRDRQTQEDTEMMIRLIGVRDCLWS